MDVRKEEELQREGEVKHCLGKAQRYVGMAEEDGKMRD